MARPNNLLSIDERASITMNLKDRTIRDDIGRVIRNVPNPINRPKVTKRELDSYMLTDEEMLR